MNSKTIEALLSGNYNLLSEMPLRCLWTHTSHLKKHGRQFLFDADAVSITAATSRGASRKRQRSVNSVIVSCNSALLNNATLEPISNYFADPSLPLVIDIGCGYGATLIGLCYDQQLSESASRRNLNFLGCDMSSGCIRYAQGISVRWKLHSNCSFVVSEGGELLEWVHKTYPGRVEWIILQFPTPFAFSAHGGL